MKILLLSTLLLSQGPIVPQTLNGSIGANLGLSAFDIANTKETEFQETNETMSNREVRKTFPISYLQNWFAGSTGNAGVSQVFDFAKSLYNDETKDNINFTSFAGAANGPIIINGKPSGATNWVIGSTVGGIAGDLNLVANSGANYTNAKVQTKSAVAFLGVKMKLQYRNIAGQTTTIAKSQTISYIGSATTRYVGSFSVTYTYEDVMRLI